MAHAQIRAHMFATPRKLVSDGRFTPEGTIQYQTIISVEGQGQTFYTDEDLSLSLNGSRSKLDQGTPVEVVATVDLQIGQVSGKPRLVARDLVALADAKS